MTEFKEPRTEIEWSRRAIINVVEVLQVHSQSLTLVGAHAVLLRTMDLDVPQMPTGDGDLGVTPDLVGDLPSIEALLADAGYEHRTTARPGLWGRTAYDEVDGTRSFREKIDLLAPPRLPGLYRYDFGLDETGVCTLYIGESVELARRASNYRNAKTDRSRQRTSRRIHKEIVEHLQAGGCIDFAIATRVQLGDG